MTWYPPAAPACSENRFVGVDQQRLVKTGGRLLKDSRYYWLLLAESRLTRRLFGTMLQRIWALPYPQAQARRLAHSVPASERRRDQGPKKCFGTEGSIDWIISANRAWRLSSWKMRPRETISFTRQGVECIGGAIRDVKMAISVGKGKGKPLMVCLGCAHNDCYRDGLVREPF